MFIVILIIDSFFLLILCLGNFDHWWRTVPGSSKSSWWLEYFFFLFSGHFYVLLFLDNSFTGGEVFGVNARRYDSFGVLKVSGNLGIPKTGIQQPVVKFVFFGLKFAVLLVYCFFFWFYYRLPSYFCRHPL